MILSLRIHSRKPSKALLDNGGSFQHNKRKGYRNNYERCNMKPDEIKALRNDLGLTKVKFARKLQVSEKTISNWESGKNIPMEILVERLERLRKKTSVKPV